MIRLYPNVVVKAQSFKGVKSVVVPNQSMTLQEILKRFVKRESLPVAREGMYEERFGDLEKLSKADITHQMERVEEIKADIAAFELKFQQRRAQAIKDAEPKPAPSPTVPPVGGAPNQTPPLQGS